MAALAKRANHVNKIRELLRRKDVIGLSMDVLHEEIMRNRRDEALKVRLQKLRAALLQEWRRIDKEVTELGKEQP